MATTKASEVGHHGAELEHQSVPHIIPGVLYPAVGGNDIHGTDIDTSHGSTYTYGELHTDGRKYYYTDIKGSKPIKDPRVGGHFGSQRHKAKSIQLLEQETATGTGKNVYSIDGREWMRLNATYNSNLNFNASWGNYIEMQTANDFIEITGYFNDVNLILLPYTSLRHFTWSLDGGSSTVVADGRTSVVSPLGITRYVDAGSLYNVGLGATLGIHTLKILNNDASNAAQGFHFWGIELIAQDTTSTANRSKIQIPSQNVVSYGKKFTVSGTPHYNPFNNQAIGDTTSHGKNTVGWTTYDSTLDTATSLGLDAWVDSGNYYRPVNGGRVIKWVDSSGNIKTSVNMMPPSAKALGSHSGNSGPHQTPWTTTYQPVLSSGAIDHTQSEVAKTFHFREFGNGSANGGLTGTYPDQLQGGSYADASMLSGTADDLAYVMDDGLTSLSGASLRIQNVSINGGLRINANSKSMYFTFIGTGIKTIRQRDNSTTEEPVTWAQNLPYGTHILELQRDGSANQVAKIDGITLETNSTTDKYLIHGSPTFFQPKKPPIPEDACVIADYMLLADFVPQTSAGVGSVSKGSRIVDCSRDLFYDASSGSNGLHHAQVSSGGFKINSNTTASAGVYFGKVPAFGTNFLWKGYDVRTRGQLKVNGSNATQTDTTGGSFGHVGYISSGSEPNLGVNTFEATNKASQELMIEHFEIASPIHTSHHYQSFETPYLHELIGGDRNMEQTHLICSADGKTWDEITRDTSYLGNAVVMTSTDTGSSSIIVQIFDEWRGSVGTGKYGFNKDFAIAHDRLICLKDGQYNIEAQTIKAGAVGGPKISVNGVIATMGHASSSDYDTPNATFNAHLNRGDYIQCQGAWYASLNHSYFQIKRI